MAIYGSPEGVAALVRHMTNNRAFTSNQGPTAADITNWLDERSSLLTSMLVNAGYVTPITHEDAKRILDRYANYGAAADAELSLMSSGSDENEDNQREGQFLKMWNEAAAWIESGAPRAMGVPLVESQDATNGVGVLFFGVASSGRRYGC